uniref:acyl-CoA dehydrogenase family protein n=2 Tax=Rhodococcus TaxID=1827 RepID=UPI001595474B|nr:MULTISPECIES: acyl-CoA dehydrogenase family protein [unclassified Rhodococcus (in: high G+C Gram-positive bacteria)]
MPEDQGGAGGEVADVVDVVSTVVRRGVCTPLIEHMLAGWLASETGAERLAGTGTIALGTSLAVERSDGEVRLSGRLDAVPWASAADWLTIILPPTSSSLVEVATVNLRDDAVDVQDGSDIVGAPLCDVVLANALSQNVGHNETSIDHVRQRGALLYAAAMTAAARAVVDATVLHTSDRSQFGRPLSKFQAVQQRIAQLAMTAVAMERAVEAATDAVAAGLPDAEVSVASAKVIVSGAVAAIAAGGHQLHGAIGFTSEHSLGRHTGSMQSWRNRWGSDDEWARTLASIVLDDDVDVWDVVSDGTGHVSSVPR